MSLFDFSGAAGVNSPFAALWFIIQHGGWIFLIPPFIYGGWEAWLEYIRNRFDSRIEKVLLALDIPKANEQSPKAVEHIFSHLYGILDKGTKQERYYFGYTQYTFSLELVSIGGYIQFLIRTPVKFRDLVEAAVYAQYPDAEITEVEDYVDMAPRPEELPHPEYDIWGTEMQFAKKDMYPIRTYPAFEHPLSQKFLDPMASLLEILSRMGPDEQIWMQLIIEPIPDNWKEAGMREIYKLIGKQTTKKGGAGDLLYFPRQLVHGLSESLTASVIPPTEMLSEDVKQQKNELIGSSQMLHLAPAERSIVESIGFKISKLGFRSKFRIIYIAKRNVFKKDKGVKSVIGAVSQFNTQDLNSLRINKQTKTTTYYMFINARTLARKKRILRNYRMRSLKRGRKKFILNTEELATLWHFPVLEVRAPMVQKTQAKKGEPPSYLPIETSAPIKHEEIKHKPTVAKKAPPPDNLSVGSS